MLYILFAIIPTIIFYNILNIRNIYKIFLSILFWIFLVIFGELFSSIIFNLYCTLTDKVGYNQITDFMHYISTVSEYIFLTFLTVILFITYKKQSKKLFKYIILLLLFVISFFIFNFISKSIYFTLIENFGYYNIYTNIYNLLHRCLIVLILIGMFYGIKKVTQK